MTKKNIILILCLMISFSQGCNLNKKIPEESILEENKEIETTNIENNNYESKSENFMFDFPKDWTMKENQYGFSVLIFTPKDDEINENVGVNVQKLQKFLSVQEYYEQTSSELKETLIGFKEIKAEDIQKDVLNGKKITYEHSVGDKNLVSEQTFLISPENVVYIINYTATKDTFDKFLFGANIILNSFKTK